MENSVVDSLYFYESSYFVVSFKCLRRTNNKINENKLSDKISILLFMMITENTRKWIFCRMNE